MRTQLFISFFIGCSLLFLGCREGKIEPLLTGIITGQVIFADDLSPLSEVTIRTNPASSSVLTDSDGNFTLNDIPIGAYTIQAEKEGYLTKFESVNVNDNASTEVAIKLSLITEDNVPPTQPSDPLPADGAVDVPLTVELNWTSTDANANDELTYDVSNFKCFC